MSADQVRSSGQTFREVGRIARPWEEGRRVVCKMRKGVCMKIVVEDSKKGSRVAVKKRLNILYFL